MSRGGGPRVTAGLRPENTWDHASSTLPSRGTAGHGRAQERRLSRTHARLYGLCRAHVTRAQPMRARPRTTETTGHGPEGPRAAARGRRLGSAAALAARRCRHLPGGDARTPRTPRPGVAARPAALRPVLPLPQRPPAAPPPAARETKSRITCSALISVRTPSSQGRKRGQTGTGRHLGKGEEAPLDLPPPPSLYMANRRGRGTAPAQRRYHAGARAGALGGLRLKGVA